MSLANTELALEKAQEFLALLHDGWNEHGQRLEGKATAEMRGMLPLMRDIATRAHPELVSALVEAEPDVDGYLNPIWRWDGVKEATQTLVGVLQNLNIREQILGPSGPTLAAEGLHPWVWHAAVDLWDDGHFKNAVNAAAAAVEEQTQLKLDREDLSGTKLYTEAFKLDTKPVSMASGICPVAASRTAHWRPPELPTGGQVFCPQVSWSVASPPFRRWLG